MCGRTRVREVCSVLYEIQFRGGCAAVIWQRPVRRTDAAKGELTSDPEPATRPEKTITKEEEKSSE